MIREFDETCLSLCKFQGRLFEKSLTSIEGSSPVFIKCFMKSVEASHMDEDGFLFESEDVESVLSQLKRKHSFGRGTTKYSENSLYWMGYLYRYWCYTYLLSSKEVYRIIRADELFSLYLPYHTLDVGAAINRILEAKNMISGKNALDCLKKAYGMQ